MPDVPPIPSGFHSITPYLVVRGAAEAIDFYKRAFGADEVARQTDEHTGLIMNAKLTIGDSIIMLSDEFPGFGCLAPAADRPSPVMIHLYVEDVDAVFEQAVAAGAEATMPVADMFWGDRYGMLRDPFSHIWTVGTHIEDLTPEEITERAREAFVQP
jgi:uncharacterized glyoxalase superfamily protein PhnB